MARASSFRISANAKASFSRLLVVAVVQRVDHRHRAGQRVLDLALRLAAQERGVVDVDRMPARDRAHDHRHVGVVAVADAHRLLVGEVHAVQSLDEGRHEVTARLLAVGDDVDARVLLVEQREADGVALALARAPRHRASRGPTGSPARRAMRAWAGCPRSWSGTALAFETSPVPIAQPPLRAASDYVIRLDRPTRAPVRLPAQDTCNFLDPTRHAKNTLRR